MLKLPKRKWVPVNNKDFLTIQEIMDETGEGRSWAEKFTKTMLDSGKWTIAYKKINGRPIRAVGHE